MSVSKPATSLTIHGAVAVLEIDSPPVNALGHNVRVSIKAGIDQANAAAEVSAIVLACAGRTFCAGADISEFGREPDAPDLNEVLAAVEASPKPVVAALHGTALGGGLELALACSYRIAASSAKVGLPEVSLGLLPGAGGTQRTPRLIGAAKAIELIVGGKPIAAEKAMSIGLIDRVVGDSQLRSEAVSLAASLEAGAVKRVRDLPVDLSPDQISEAAEDYRRRSPQMFVGRAPGTIIKAIEAAASLPFDAGLSREHELFKELLVSDESAAQRYLFFAERMATKIAGVANIDPYPIDRVAVVGAGTMGSGIAIAFLNAGFSVSLIDLNAEALAKARARIERTIRGLVEKGRISSDAADASVARLATAATTAAVADADLVIEAVFERLDLKKSVFGEIDAIAKSGAILASNTSFLDLNAMAAATKRPEKVVGLHFFAPANIMRLLEIVRGEQTSDAVLVTAMALGRKLGKVAVLSGVCDGFIANRLMAQRGKSADRLILEGPMPWDVDREMVDFGFPMGVFRMLDLVGLDVVGWDRENSAGRTVQEILCDAGRWGQKTNGGYYDYAPDGQAIPSTVAVQAIEAIRARSGVTQRRYTSEQIVYELLDPVVNEGAKLLEENIAQRASDIDMALVAGYGWPTYKGGPMFWGDTVGLAGVVERLKRRSDAGENISISPLLERFASEGKRFVRN